MILVEAGEESQRTFEAKLQFARQLVSCGYPAFIDQESVPDDLTGTRVYDAVAFLADPQDMDISMVVVIGAEAVDEQTLRRLRNLRLASRCPVRAVGRFADRQALIAAQSRLAYSLGYEPEIVDLGRLQPKPLRENSSTPLFAGHCADLGRSRAGVADERGLLLVLPNDLLEKDSTIADLDALSGLADVKLILLTSGQGREFIRKNIDPLPMVFGFGELAPDTLAGMADVIAVFGSGGPGDRVAGVCLDMMRNGGVVIDCTEHSAIVSSGAPAVRGPHQLAGLLPFLQGNILPNLDILGQEAASHAWLRANEFSRLEKALGLGGGQVKGKGRDPARKPRVVFLPTNGVGLGHAQRASLVAARMDKGAQVGFAAYPSCIPLLQSKGFDCLPLVARSELHQTPIAHDLVNCLRLGQLLAPGDTLVFDGVFIFNSVFRTILEQKLSGVWIRRGLWQAGQARRTPLERGAVFSRVIVPDEAFDELNTDYSRGPKVRRVGPIVQERRQTAKQRDKLRVSLAERFKRPFERLIVSMLGGGVAADRSAQLQTLCAEVEAHPDWLHLIVVWPSAKVVAGLHGWANSFPVITQDALGLCQAADMMVSAGGYNSVHEAYYHAIPTIFIPQMATYMDDQKRRAQALAERDLAVALEPGDLLSLQRQVVAFLENGEAEEMRARLRKVALPERGTAAAARLIEEVSAHVE